MVRNLNSEVTAHEVKASAKPDDGAKAARTGSCEFAKRKAQVR